MTNYKEQLFETQGQEKKAACLVQNGCSTFKILYISDMKTLEKSDTHNNKRTYCLIAVNILIL